MRLPSILWGFCILRSTCDGVKTTRDKCLKQSGRLYLETRCQCSSAAAPAGPQQRIQARLAYLHPSHLPTPPSLAQRYHSCTTDQQSSPNLQENLDERISELAELARLAEVAWLAGYRGSCRSKTGLFSPLVSASFRSFFCVGEKHDCLSVCLPVCLLLSRLLSADVGKKLKCLFLLLLFCSLFVTAAF